MAVAGGRPRRAGVSAGCMPPGHRGLPRPGALSSWGAAGRPSTALALAWCPHTVLALQGDCGVPAAALGPPCGLTQASQNPNGARHGARGNGGGTGGPGTARPLAEVAWALLERGFGLERRAGQSSGSSPLRPGRPPGLGCPPPGSWPPLRGWKRTQASCGRVPGSPCSLQRCGGSRGSGRAAGPRDQSGPRPGARLRAAALLGPQARPGGDGRALAARPWAPPTCLPLPGYWRHQPRRLRARGRAHRTLEAGP